MTSYILNVPLATANLRSFFTLFHNIASDLINFDPKSITVPSANSEPPSYLQ